MENKHITNDDLNRRLNEIMDILTSAFAKNPDGSIDFDGHRRYHESMIRAADAQEKFWIELKLEIAKKGIWGLLIVVCGLVLVGITTKLGLPK
jgi:hypothetical protein